VILAPGGIASGSGAHEFDNVGFRLDSNP
jgi:hypothetical protein